MQLRGRLLNRQCAPCPISVAQITAGHVSPKNHRALFTRFFRLCVSRDKLQQAGTFREISRKGPDGRISDGRAATLLALTNGSAAEGCSCELRCCAVQSDGTANDSLGEDPRVLSGWPRASLMQRKRSSSLCLCGKWRGFSRSHPGRGHV